ncbi:MAG: hypothetical protein H0U31_02265 [Chloroflexia bacterium]|nr:hypothetical protein [Chloroflexia bacterium]
MSNVIPISTSPATAPLTLVARPRAAAIPASLTPILGRESEIGQVLALLDRDDLRVVTLLGPGGVGKTRLAQEVARTVEHDFAHGACFVSMAAIRDPELVPKAVAQALGLQESANVPAENLLIDILSSQHLLLVLDNMEQVIAASPWLTDLIAKCPRLKVLVTSRIVLNVTTEQRFVVPPLPVPDQENPDARELAAIELFGQRARAIDASFAIDERNQSTVSEICRRLDGLPLAIELAAARVNVLSPEGILARLSNRLNLLSGGRRDLDARMRSMRAAIAWSCDLLSEEEQIFFGRLAVFVGDFSLEAAAFVASYPGPPVDESEILNAIESLVNQSLVVMVESASGPRFGMLETIREYGLVELERNGREDPASHAHAEYFLTLGSMAEDDQRGARQAQWLDSMELEHHNLRNASAWLTDHGRIADAIELNAQIIYYPHARGHAREARAQFVDWLGHPSLVQRSRAHAVALVMSAGYGITAGDYATSHTMIDEAIEIFRELDDQSGLILAMTTVSLAPPTETPEARDSAIDRIEEGIELARRHGHGRFHGLMLGNLALVYEMQGDIERAHRLVGEVEQVGRATGDRWLIALHRGSRCGEALNTGDLELARRMAEEALQIYIEIEDRRHTPLAELYLGTCARAATDFAGASSYLIPALQAVRGIGDKGLEIVGLVELANLATDQGDVGTAWQWLNQVFEAISISDSPEMVPACLDVLARIGQVTGQCDQAARFLGAADGLLELFATNRVWKHEVDAYRRTVEALESALGAVEFERLSGAGRSLSVEEAFVELLAFAPIVALAAPDPVGHEPKPGHPLSTREVEVLTLMADGLSNAEIADKLFLSLRTVTSHITHVLGKLNLNSRTAAVAFAIRKGIV